MKFYKNLDDLFPSPLRTQFHCISTEAYVTPLAYARRPTFCRTEMVQCVKLMLSKFLHYIFLLFDCFVCHQNLTCLKRFTRYGHYTGKVEDIIIDLQLFLNP